MKNLKISRDAVEAFIGVAILIIVFFTSVALYSPKENDNVVIIENAYDPGLERQQKMDSLRTEIVSEIDKYIVGIAPKTKVDSELMFDLCDMYEVDVRFVMTQGQIESHYATAGTAAKTNSIFNVGAYDGHSAERQRRNGFGFDHPNESIEPYLILLTQEYLVNGKTVHDLMKNFVNYQGLRYASSPTYENTVKSVYNRINKKTNLDILLQEYNEAKYEIYD